MKKQKVWMVCVGAVALIVVASRLPQTIPGKVQIPSTMQNVEESIPADEEILVKDETHSEEQKQEPFQIVEEVDAIPEIIMQVEEDVAEGNLSNSESRPTHVEVEEPSAIEEVDLPAAEIVDESEAVTSIESQADQEDQVDQEIQEIGAEEVDEIEDSLSAGDYAKGLSLLAQLPIETVDRFVELRKDGFTREEQTEVKTILLASFEGEDLEWIVKTYKKLQP